MADLLLHWITGGRSDLATLLQADEILSGSGTDARQQQVVEMVRRLATGQITWEQYASETKKRLIRHRLPKRPPTPPGAIGLVAAARALEQMLVDANAADGALLESVWYVVNAFARLPVSPPEGSFIQDDMCL